MRPFYMAHKTNALTQAEYRSVRAWSNSDLSMVNKSPALLEWSRNAPSDGSESVDLGTHVHCALLEPHIFARDYVKIPEFDARSNAGKAAKESFIQSMGDGKIVLDHDTYQTVIDMRDSVLAHPVARQLLKSPGESEVSIFGEIQGMKVKCRPDRIVDPSAFDGQHILVDVKKCASISEFAKSVISFRYNVQQAFYSDIYEQYSGIKPRFAFIVVGERREIGRHPVRVWSLPDKLVEKGRGDYLADLEMAREYQSFGCGLDIEELFIPDYLLKR